MVAYEVAGSVKVRVGEEGGTQTVLEGRVSGLYMTISRINHGMGGGEGEGDGDGGRGGGCVSRTPQMSSQMSSLSFADDEKLKRKSEDT